MTYTTGDTPRPDPEKTGLRTRIENQRLKIAALEAQIARLQELIARQAAAAGVRDLRKEKHR